MKSISTKEFFEKLNSNNLKPVSKLLGVVKKAEKESEILFAFKGDLSRWINIPESMIEGACILENIPSEEGDELTLVKLHLKTPSTPEGAVLFELLSILSGKINKIHKIKWMKKMIMEQDIHGCHMHDHCNGSGMEDLNCHHSCKRMGHCS
jgi:hypothetical protein